MYQSFMYLKYELHIHASINTRAYFGELADNLGRILIFAFINFWQYTFWRVSLKLSMNTKLNQFAFEILFALDLCYQKLEKDGMSFQSCAEADTAKNTVISPNCLVWKFCGKAQFPHSFERFARNCAETVPFHKISTPGN